MGATTSPATSGPFNERGTQLGNPSNSLHTNLATNLPTYRVPAASTAPLLQTGATQTTSDNKRHFEESSKRFQEMVRQASPRKRSRTQAFPMHSHFGTSYESSQKSPLAETPAQQTVPVQRAATAIQRNPSTKQTVVPQETVSTQQTDLGNRHSSSETSKTTNDMKQPDPKPVLRPTAIPRTVPSTPAAPSQSFSKSLTPDPLMLNKSQSLRIRSNLPSRRASHSTSAPLNKLSKLASNSTGEPNELSNLPKSSRLDTSFLNEQFKEQPFNPRATTPPLPPTQNSSEIDDLVQRMVRMSKEMLAHERNPLTSTGIGSSSSGSVQSQSRPSSGLTSRLPSHKSSLQGPFQPQMEGPRPQSESITAMSSRLMTEALAPSPSITDMAGNGPIMFANDSRVQTSRPPSVSRRRSRSNFEQLPIPKMPVISRPTSPDTHMAPYTPSEPSSADLQKKVNSVGGVQKRSTQTAPVHSQPSSTTLNTQQFSIWGEPQWRHFINAMRASLETSSTQTDDILQFLSSLRHNLPMDMQHMTLNEVVQRMMACKASRTA